MGSDVWPISYDDIYAAPNNLVEGKVKLGGVPWSKAAGMLGAA